jgi:hypothetical protein
LGVKSFTSCSKFETKHVQNLNVSSRKPTFTVIPLFHFLIKDWQICFSLKNRDKAMLRLLETIYSELYGKLYENFTVEIGIRWNNLKNKTFQANALSWSLSRRLAGIISANFITAQRAEKMKNRNLEL